MNGTSMEQTIPQTNVHPMAAAAAPAQAQVLPQPQTLPIQNVPPPTGKTSAVTTITMGKLSLFSITLSLMLLGALTFLSGFLLGMWFSAPTPGSYLAPLSSQGQTMEAIPSPAAPEQYPTSAGDTSLGSKLQSIASQQAGTIAQSTVTQAKPTNIPSFLTPLVSATAAAIGKQAGMKTQQEASQLINQASSTVHSAVTTPAPPPGMPTITPNTSVPTAAPQPSPSSMAQPSAASPTSSEKYTIQLGVYASKENATNLVSQLQGLNINASITQSKAPDGTTVYYVHSGLYGDYNMANEAASQFADQIPGALVVKVSENTVGQS
jgi:cell division septation protein DedD